MATLIGAIYHSDIDQLRLLLEQNQPIAKINDVLHFAINFGADVAIDLLLQYGADPYSNDTRRKGTTLHAAIYRGDLTIIEKLLQRKMDPNVQDNEGDTPLHVVANVGREKRLPIMTQMLKYHADVNIKNGRGETPLYDVIRESDVINVQFLLDHGADISLVNNANRTPLEVAEEQLVDADPLFCDVDSARTIIDLLRDIPDIKEPVHD
jgi:ankyrin repeat protein